MEEQRLIVRRSGARSSSEVLREISTVLFRQSRVMALLFLATFAGVIIAMLVGAKYEATTKILVKHRRANETVSTDASSREQESSSLDMPTEREINTEISLLRSNDLLETVTRNTGLDSEKEWWPWWPSKHEQGWKTAKAVQRLGNVLRIAEVPQSNMIGISYSSRSPEKAARVLSELDSLYLAKHLQVNRPPGVFEFFERQAKSYREELSEEEGLLASFDRKENTSNPDLEKEILLRKANDFDAVLKQTRSEIQETSRRVQEIRNEMEKTPQRLPTQLKVGDNPQLMADLKSRLQELENKRTELVAKYDPSYRLVQEVDQQIVDVRATIDAEGHRPVKEESTDRNPTYDLLQSELVRANANLAALQAKANATAPIVLGYSEDALLADKRGLQRQDLIRRIKTTEANYLLYQQKEEQARISDALDNNRILNVAIAEAPTIPRLPVTPPWMVLLSGGVLALVISLAGAFVTDYFDPSFRTPAEVAEYLELEVLASFPKNGRLPRFFLPPPSGEMPALSAGEEGRAAWPLQRNAEDRPET